MGYIISNNWHIRHMKDIKWVVRCASALGFTYKEVTITGLFCKQKHAFTSICR